MNCDCLNTFVTSDKIMVIVFCYRVNEILKFYINLI